MEKRKMEEQAAVEIKNDEREVFRSDRQCPMALELCINNNTCTEDNCECMCDCGEETRDECAWNI